jgi:tetratricopeptide (TPR) repeat protein
MDFLVVFWKWLAAEGNQKTLKFVADSISAMVDIGRKALRPDSTPHHNLPWANQSFVNRRKELATLVQALAKAGPRRPARPQVITGMGGIGKTQLALHFAYRQLELRRYKRIRWLRAEEPATLANDYARLGEPLRLGAELLDQAARRDAIRDRLEGQDRWLLIFDNAPGPARVSDYLPRTGAVHVLITSRERHWRDIAQPIELAPLPPDEAVELLVNPSLDPRERAEAERLAEDLGCIPLALALARAYRDEQALNVSTTRQHYAAAVLQPTPKPGVIIFAPEGAGYPHSLASVWDSSIKEAGERCAAARQLLEVLAFLAPRPFPRALLECTHTQPGGRAMASDDGLGNPEDRLRAIAVLHNFRLLEAKGETLTLHPLVQAVVRSGLDQPDMASRAEAAVRLVSARLPRPPWEYTYRGTIESLLPHAVEATGHAERLGVGLDAVGEVLNEVGMYLAARAVYGEAERFHKRALAIFDKHGPERSLGLTCSILANLYRDTRRRPEEAERLYRAAIAIAERTLTPGDYELGKRLCNLARFYKLNDRPGEAGPVYRRAEAILEKHLREPERPDRAELLSNLAWLYQNTGRHAEAEPLHRSALETDRRVLGALDRGHPGLGNRLVDLADLLRHSSRFAEAEPLYREAVEILEHRLTPDHPHLRTAVEGLADVLDRLGRAREASRHRARAEAGRRTPRSN